MDHTKGPGRPRKRLSAVLVLMLLAAAALCIAAPAAFAQSDYTHPGAASCLACHTSIPPSQPGTNAACQTCHTGFVLRSGFDCWTCHKPGVKPATTQAGCTGVCHEWTSPDTYTTDVTPHPVTQHQGSNLEDCTTCHAISLSDKNANGSPHHVTATLAPPTCTTCHANPPVDGAPAPHPTFVATGCTTCHEGMTPHPPASQLIKPTLTIAAAPAVTVGDETVSGSLKAGATGLGPVHVFLQVKAPTASSYAPLTEVDTAVDGTYTFTVKSATPGAFYRAISEGEADGTTYMPALASTELVKATLTLKLSSTSIKAGKTVTARGVLGPASLAGQSVKLLAQKKKGAKWVKAGKATKATNGTTGAYSWKFRAKTKGTYRIMASIPKTTAHTAAKTAWRTFKAK
jgi:hypothetical protein